MRASATQRANRAAKPTAPTSAPKRGAGHPKKQKAHRPASRRARGLDRAVEVFQLLHAVRKPITIGEISRRLGAPRSSIYEIVNRYLASEMLEYAGNGSEVFFGRALYLYANDYFATHTALRLAQEEVRHLAALTGETAQFCMPIGNKYTVVAMQNSSRLFRISSDVGVLVPIPWTASGRFFVAHMSLEELIAFVPPEDFRMQDGRVSDPAAFLAEATAARERGLCVLSGHVDDFATCLAVPILDAAGVVFGCICFAVAHTLPNDRIEELSRLLIESGHKLSGFQGEGTLDVGAVA